MRNILKYCLTFFVTVVIIISCVLYIQDDNNPKVKGYINVFVKEDSYEYLKQCSDKFMEDNNKAHIEINSIDDYSEILNNEIYNKYKFTNVLLLNRLEFENLNENNIIKYKDMRKILDTYSKNFSKSRINQVRIEDKSIGVPLNSKPIVLYIRSDMLREYGYSSDDINTWDDFIKLGIDIYNRSNGTVQILNATGSDYEDLLSLIIMQCIDEDKTEDTIKNEVKERIDTLRNNNILNLNSDGKFLARISSIDAMRELKALDVECEWTAINPPSISLGTNRFYCEEGDNLIVLDDEQENAELVEKFITYLITNTKVSMDYIQEGKFFSSFLYTYKNIKTEGEIKNFTGKSPLVVMSNTEERAPIMKQYDKYIKIKSELLD
ncbi:extracellular solute-binding protein [Clostridium botulinum]|uniref:extracellular solute-binding protein n=1 Tax=Clostridium sp. ZBS4 TaxID=2949974 RepID=UPI0013F03398|nr:extracellular solute-binding protein [Clostridium sp. ZBS4]NFS30298.1 extracellular solute-binding protein [Clostridium botulinum]NFS54905.1 extracellular solute-binding protein [Clostridium botulinum]NFT18854.1 extracellular solute-binding protein [Clostridium botulinum]